jgi:hypothetical protein
VAIPRMLVAIGSRPQGLIGVEQERAGGLKPQLLKTVLGATRAMTYSVSRSMTTPTISDIPIPRAMRPVRRTCPV